MCDFRNKLVCYLALLGAFLLPGLVEIDAHGFDKEAIPITSNSTPKWLQDHMIFMTEGTGRWVADNSQYRNETEISDEYVTEWTWGAGKNSISGRLFAINGGQETENIWEFNLFWHPKQKKAILHQLGRNGVFGEGEMKTVTEEGVVKRLTEITFYVSDGTSWKDLHQILESDGEHETTSFFLKDESWVRRRTYTWKRIPATP